jgi:hypothetical protein
MWGSGRKQTIMVCLKKRLSKNKDSLEVTSRTEVNILLVQQSAQDDTIKLNLIQRGCEDVNVVTKLWDSYNQRISLTSEQVSLAL